MTTSRLYFLDNLRWMMIARVVLFHTTAAYCGLPEFFHETQAGGFIAGLRIAVLIIPGMSILFFIAGFFALPSLERRGSAGFLRGKLVRLGIPALLCVYFLGPVMPFLGYYSQSYVGLSSDSYWDFWTQALSGAFQLTPVETAFRTSQPLHPMHYWFLASLVIYLVGLVIVRSLGRRWFHPTWLALPASTSASADEPPTERVPGTEVLRATLVMSLLLVPFTQLEMSGDIFFGLLRADAMGLAMHAAVFGLGVHASVRGWFTHRHPPGLDAIGMMLGMLAATAAVGAALHFGIGEQVDPHLIVLLPFAFSSSVCFAIIITANLAVRFLNRTSPTLRRLAAASYPVYLLHYPLILLFRLPLLTVDWPAPVKALVVFVLTASASVTLALWLLRPHPRLAVALLLVGHLVLLGTGLPRSSWSHLLLDRAARLHEIVRDTRPERVELPETAADETAADEMTATEMGNPFDPPVSVAWSDGGLLAAQPARGLLRIEDGVPARTISDSLLLGSMAPAPGGLWAIDRQTLHIVRLDAEGQIAATLVDSSVDCGRPWHLVADGGDGIFFSAGRGDSSGIWHAAPGSPARRVAVLPGARGVALDPSGDVLYAVAAGDIHVRAWDRAPDGTLTRPREVAELFRGDGRYGRTDLERSYDVQPEALFVDETGHLYVASLLGLQVFTSDGELLGVVDFPDVPLRINRIRPHSIAGAPGRLFVSCGAEVYLVEKVNG